MGYYIPHLFWFKRAEQYYFLLLIEGEVRTLGEKMREQELMIMVRELLIRSRCLIGAVTFGSPQERRLKISVTAEDLQLGRTTFLLHSLEVERVTSGVQQHLFGLSGELDSLLNQFYRCRCMLACF